MKLSDKKKDIKEMFEVFDECDSLEKCHWTEESQDNLNFVIKPVAELNNGDYLHGPHVDNFKDIYKSLPQKYIIKCTIGSFNHHIVENNNLEELE